MILKEYLPDILYIYKSPDATLGVRMLIKNFVPTIGRVVLIVVLIKESDVLLL